MKNKCLSQEAGEQPPNLPEGYKCFYCAKCGQTKISSPDDSFCMYRSIRKGIRYNMFLAVFALLACLWDISAAYIDGKNTILFLMNSGFSLWMGTIFYQSINRVSNYRQWLYIMKIPK